MVKRFNLIHTTCVDGNKTGRINVETMMLKNAELIEERMKQNNKTKKVDKQNQRHLFLLKLCVTPQRYSTLSYAQIMTIYNKQLSHT